MEYSIDELGMLALHTRISDMQTSTHIVNVAEVQEIVDEAIDHANRKNITHFFDILLAKRYDDEDMMFAKGSALYSLRPSGVVIRNLYISPVPTPGTKRPCIPPGPRRLYLTGKAL